MGINSTLQDKKTYKLFIKFVIKNVALEYIVKVGWMCMRDIAYFQKSPWVYIRQTSISVSDETITADKSIIKRLY